MKRMLLCFFATLFIENSNAQDVIGYDGSLYRGQQLTSANGMYSLQMRDDGVLALYRADGALMWSADRITSGCSAGFVTKFGYGFDIYAYYEKHSTSKLGCMRWYMNPAPVKTPYFSELSKYNTYTRIQDDGNLVVTTIEPLWNSKSSGEISTGATDLKFPPGTTFYPGSIYNIGIYKFALQTDGNFVIYKRDIAIWHTMTHGKNVHRAAFQEDGNFVIYDLNNHPIWHTQTHGNPGSYLSMQADGNLVIYKPTPVWGLWGVTLPAPTKPPKAIYPSGSQFMLPVWSSTF